MRHWFPIDVRYIWFTTNVKGLHPEFVSGKNVMIATNSIKMRGKNGLLRVSEISVSFVINVAGNLTSIHQSSVGFFAGIQGSFAEIQGSYAEMQNSLEAM